jgi:hypothetical protein
MKKEERGKLETQESQGEIGSEEKTKPNGLEQ